MPIKSFQDLYTHELKDLYSAEKQITEALPKMAKAAESSELRQAFEAHLQETEVQIERLRQIFSLLDVNPGSTKCKAMEGLVAEGDDMIKSIPKGEIRDAALIAAAQRVEHYEMAGYGTVRTYAQILGFEDHRDLLQQTLDEEGATDDKLNALAERLNKVAVAQK